MKGRTDKGLLENMRLDKFLSNMGVVSRRELKSCVKKGEVTVNGDLAKASDMQVDENKDVVVFRGETIEYNKYIYIMLNKPSGYLSATEDARDKTVLELLDERHRKMELFPVGRLDKDTEGLLILTNDGELCHKLLSPKHHVEKKYYVKSQSELDDSAVKAFEEGVHIDGGYKTLPAFLEITDNACESFITLHEGKFHQIKQMFRAIGNVVVYLERVRFGTVSLDRTLERGEWRYLSWQEVSELRSVQDK